MTPGQAGEVSAYAQVAFDAFWSSPALGEEPPSPLNRESAGIRNAWERAVGAVLKDAFPGLRRELNEAREALAAQDARPAPTSASQVRRHEAQAASDLADDFYFERKQVVALRAVLGEVFTCLAAGDPALLDDEQVAEWRERARMEES